MKRNYLLLFVLFSAFFMLQTGFAQTPVMNELYSRGITSDPDWIEIYNPTASSIDITGYKIYDGGGNAGTKPKKLFPGGSVIPANGFLVIVVDDTDSSGLGYQVVGIRFGLKIIPEWLLIILQFLLCPIQLLHMADCPMEVRIGRY